MTSRYEVLGKAVWLYSHSKLHREWTMSEIERWLIPPIVHQQYRLFEIDGSPIGWGAWAWLGDEEQTKYMHEPGTLDPKDWRSGKKLWAIDFCAPFGHIMEIKRQIRKSEFAGHRANFIRVRPDSEIGRVGAVFDRHALIGYEKAGR